MIRRIFTSLEILFIAVDPESEKVLQMTMLKVFLGVF
jgi:hypothetical protein